MPAWIAYIVMLGVSIAGAQALGLITGPWSLLVCAAIAAAGLALALLVSPLVRLLSA